MRHDEDIIPLAAQVKTKLIDSAAVGVEGGEALALVRVEVVRGGGGGELRTSDAEAECREGVDERGVVGWCVEGVVDKDEEGEELWQGWRGGRHL